MSARAWLLLLIQAGAHKPQVFKFFKEKGYGYRTVEAFLEEKGIFFPQDIVYNDLNPTPERKNALQQLSLGD